MRLDLWLNPRHGFHHLHEPDDPLLLKRLAFSQLRDLTVAFRKDGSIQVGARPTLRELCRTLLRSGCRLTNFTFTGSPIHLLCVQRLLHTSPTIASLDISLHFKTVWQLVSPSENCGEEGDDNYVPQNWSLKPGNWPKMFDAFWDEMNPGRSSQSLADSPLLLPNLTSLAWSNCENSETFYRKLLEVVSARRDTSGILRTTPVTRLLSLELGMDDDMRSQIYPELEI